MSDELTTEGQVEAVDFRQHEVPEASSAVDAAAEPALRSSGKKRAVTDTETAAEAVPEAGQAAAAEDQAPAQPAKRVRKKKAAQAEPEPEPEPEPEGPEAPAQPAKRVRKKKAAQAEPEPEPEPEGPEAPAQTAKRARKKKAAQAEPEPEPAAEPEAAAAAPEIEIPENALWYVVHTYSGYENKVKQNLEHRIESMGMLDQIFQVVVPVEEEVDIKDGQRRIVERKIFPGYVLVRMILTDESWSVVRNTPAVTGFVGSGTDASDRLRPTPLRQDDVDRILRRMDAEEPTIRVTFRTGQNVRIVDGPFTDFHGVVDTIDMDRGKVRLMVNFFGRDTPVELDFLQVEKV